MHGQVGDDARSAAHINTLIDKEHYTEGKLRFNVGQLGGETYSGS